ncbi:F-box protein [Parachlamydia sp. AcF125]|uniref:F-box protein n=1 Tax=Parachlamydia sp. AcF125 TaxID=2795736 RepID=UPI001BC942D4|nr:F-box protein [Parachlamydia sp. AcF125]MBS4168773.1 hypothetical protein [Parachlamydia sp. AcF125]
MQPLSQATPSQLNLIDLPDIPFLKIFSCLDPRDVRSCTWVCRKFKFFSDVCTHDFATQSQVFSIKEIERSHPTVHAKVLRVVKCAKKFFPEIKIVYEEFSNFLKKESLNRELSSYLNVEEQPIEFVKILLKCGAQSDIKNLYRAISKRDKELVDILLSSRDPEAPWYREGMIAEFQEDKFQTVAIVKNFEICCFALTDGTPEIFQLVLEKTLGSLEIFKNLAKEDELIQWELENLSNQNKISLEKITKKIVKLSQAIKKHKLKKAQDILKEPLWDQLLEVEESNWKLRNDINTKDNRYELCCYALTAGTPKIFLSVLHRLFDSLEEFMQANFKEDMQELMEESLRSLLPQVALNYHLRKRWFAIDVKAKKLQKAIFEQNFARIKKIIRKREREIPPFIKTNTSFEEWQKVKQTMDYEIGRFALLKGTPESFLVILEELHISLEEFIQLANKINRHSGKEHTVLYLLSNTEHAADPKRVIEGNLETIYGETDKDVEEEAEAKEQEEGLDSTLDIVFD